MNKEVNEIFEDFSKTIVSTSSELKDIAESVGKEMLRIENFDLACIEAIKAKKTTIYLNIILWAKSKQMDNIAYTKEAHEIMLKFNEAKGYLINYLYENIHPETKQTKAEKLKIVLFQYGFFDLDKVKAIPENKRMLLIENLVKKGLPYTIAMFDFLGFMGYLNEKHFTTKYKLNKEISVWFESDQEGRAVKGNISSLSKKTTENKSRYTAHKYKETVKEDYKKLK